DRVFGRLVVGERLEDLLALAEQQLTALVEKGSTLKQIETPLLQALAEILLAVQAAQDEGQMLWRGRIDTDQQQVAPRSAQGDGHAHQRAGPQLLRRSGKGIDF